MQADEHTCSLCRRIVPRELITRHHLTPKSRGGGADNRVHLCKPCHKQIHATFTNRQLERDYSDLRALHRAPELQSFLKWIRRQKPTRNFRTVVANRRTESRRG
jgi:5-methylcytosine-specific restriction endonuclease McrA